MAKPKRVETKTEKTITKIVDLRLKGKRRYTRSRPLHIKQARRAG